MANNVAPSVPERTSETLKSVTSARLKGDPHDSFQRAVQRLSDRGALTIRVFTGSNIPIPSVKTAADVLAELDLLIPQQARQTGAFEAPLDTLENPSAASQLLDTLWLSVQRFYRFHMRALLKSVMSDSSARRMEQVNMPSR